MSDTIDRADMAAASAIDLTPDEIVAAAVEFEALHEALLVYDPTPAGAALKSVGAEFDAFLREYAARPERLIVEVDMARA